MRTSTLFSILPLLVTVLSSPIHPQRGLSNKIEARHVIDGRQIAHGAGLESGHALASTTIFLEDSEGLALVASRNFTTVIVETPSGSKTSTLVAAWGSQPIYSLGQGAGYILGVPEHVYAPFSFPAVQAATLPLQVCTFVFAEPIDLNTNFTINAREAFAIEDFAKQLNLGESVSELCVRVGHAPTTSVPSGGNQPTTTPAPGNGNGNGGSSPFTSAAISASAQPSPAPVTPSAQLPPPEVSNSASTPPSAPSSSPSVEVPVVVQPSTSSQQVTPPGEPSSPSSVKPNPSSAAASASSQAVSIPVTASNAPSTTSAAPSASVSVSGSIEPSSSASASVSAAPSVTVSASSSASASSSTSASASASSSAPSSSASATSTGPNPAYQTTVSFAGKSYINKGLVAFGSIDGDAVDSYGETIGSLGSAIHLQSFQQDSNGSFSGVMVTQPDRGHNTDTTTDYISRRHYISFNLHPYYGNSSLEYQAAKSSFPLKYESTVRYFETDGTPTTGLDATAVRNGSVPQPIASETYNHISTDPEGLVILPDGSSWVSDEYGPYIWKYSAEGVLLDTIVPPQALLPYLNGTLYFTAESKVKPQTGRKPNQGYEGLTASPDGKTLYALMQSGTMQDLDKNGEGRYARMFVYDISSKPELKHSYVVKLPVTNGKGKTLAQSDVMYVSDNTFLLLSRDGKGNGDEDSESKHKDFMLLNFDGATDIVNTEYTNGVRPISPAGILDKDITAIEPVQFIDIIDEVQLGRFGLHNAGKFDVSLINSKWESAAIVPAQDPEYPNDYFLFSFSDNDFITTNGFEAGEKYVDQYGSTLDNQALVWRVTLP